MPGPRPPAFSACPAARLAAVDVLLTDIDDTLTRDGAIEPVALQALHDLQGAGIPVVAITGRPLGWSLPFARAWPVAAIVAENGAVALLVQPNGGEPAIEFTQDEATRAGNAVRLRLAAERVLREVPGTRLAQDSAGRVTDIAVDHSEFARLTPAQVEAVVATMRAEGLHATVSSIHVNGWFGSHDKLSAARWMAARLFGRRLDDTPERWLYVGDSTNDQLMFRSLPLTVGVANLMHFADRLVDWPAWITDGARGLGFAEVAEALLAARGLRAGP